jgi:hypothetical protein
MRAGRLFICLVLLTVVAVTTVAQQPAADVKAYGRELLKELIETNTTHSTGNVTTASERMAARLLAAGFPKADVQVVGGKETQSGRTLSRPRYAQAGPVHRAPRCRRSTA